MLKTLAEFDKDLRMKSGFSSWCKKCRNEANIASRNKNREPSRRASRKYRKIEREKYPNKPKEAHARMVAKNPGYDAQKAREWRKNNPDKVRWQGRIKRLRKIGNGGKMTWEQWVAMVQHYGNKCLACGEPGTPRSLQMDHVKPLALGGNSDPGNIQPLCPSCNNSKGKKEIDYRPKSWKG
jgi:5-methylcytosine-specific restriction endonuclease McrA